MRDLVLGPLLLAFAMTNALSRPSAAQDSTVVATDAGTVRGVRTDDVIAFKGIPYARPPVGALRWRPPQPVHPWSGALEATRFRSDCIQPRRAGLPAFSLEDCLYINVWHPAAAAEGPRPVMVWIHGGGLVRGGASIYPLESLAREGIVAVSFNYRLGRFGFFAHPALATESPDAARGNYGYMDQIAALEWVRRNIAAFGGDPDNVTIAGESAGGGSVLVLLTSPMARGLFHRAILQSPGIPSPRAAAGPMRELGAAERIAVDYARMLGIKGTDSAALAQLRRVSATTLNDGTGDYVSAIFGGREIPGLSHSIIDGRLVVEPPEVALRAGRHAMVPVLVGANDADLAVTPAHTKDALFAQFGASAPWARAVYDPAGDGMQRTLAQSIAADRNVLEPVRYLAEAMSRAGQPAYYYRFSYVAKGARSTVHGATQGSEIAYAFDAVPAVFGGTATADDLAMARTMSGYWAAFARAGDPNGGGRLWWPPFDPYSGTVLHFTNGGVVVCPDPARARLDLWRAVWEGLR